MNSKEIIISYHTAAQQAPHPISIVLWIANCDWKVGFILGLIIFYEILF